MNAVSLFASAAVPSATFALSTPPLYWIALLVVGGVLVLLVVSLALRIVFQRKHIPVPVPTCRNCGAPLGADGRCPNGCVDIVPPPPVSWPPPPPVETCPLCGADLENDVCPHCGPPEMMQLGGTIPRCPVCDTIIKDGVCPKCGETEYCPTCGSELADGICPNGCTIVRCPDCGKIMINGVCPHGDAKALCLGWSGSAKPTMSPWKLEVVAPAKHVSEVCELPFEAVLGRSASERKTTETYIQLQFEDKRKASACPRRYVKLVCDSATAEVAVEMLSRVGRAVVDGRTLSAPGDKAVLPEGGILDLQQTGYRLKLVRASAEESAR